MTVRDGIVYEKMRGTWQRDVPRMSKIGTPDGGKGGNMTQAKSLEIGNLIDDDAEAIQSRVSQTGRNRVEEVRPGSINGRLHL